MPLTTSKGHARKEHGASLIEVLVAILIVSLGVIALGGLLAKSTQLAKGSEYRSVANLLATDMADRMKANLLGVTGNGYNLNSAALSTVAPPNAPACVNLLSCTAAEMAAQDLAQWQQALVTAFPGGAAGYIQYDLAALAAGAFEADLWVAWKDADAISGAASKGNVDFAGTDNSMCPPALRLAGASCVFMRVSL